ncbi:MAG: M28 family peptidase, partial [Deltaproteobacteria bacterium]|nr:M28 family peptidase [Deltaproteobacteria bacterium]
DARSHADGQAASDGRAIPPADGGGSADGGGQPAGDGGGQTVAELAAELAALVDPAEYRRDLLFIAQPRPPGNAHWQAVQELCATRFAEHGWIVERQEYGSGVNVIGTRPGRLARGGMVLVSAHYDHIPGCPGADDNGSGVAGTLQAARILAAGQFERTLAVACWDQEEDGLVGSLAFATRARQQGAQVVMSFVLEMIGYASTEPGSQVIPYGFDMIFTEQAAWVEQRQHRGDFVAVVVDDQAPAATAALARHGSAIGLPVLVLELSEQLRTSPMLYDLARSDHAAFWFNGYPGMMITDTSNFRNPCYHCAGGPDTVDTLDLGFAVLVVRATVAAAAEIAVARERGRG